MLQKEDLNSARAKLVMTQKLLGKIDKEIETQKNKKQIDSQRLFEIINKSFQTYELCAQEFCFELELMQLSFVGTFFKQYMQGYHKIINLLLKYTSEKLEITSQMQKSQPQKNISKQNESDSSRESSPALKKDLEKNPAWNNNNETFDKKVNLIDKFQKIDQMTKFQMELNSNTTTKQEENSINSINMLPLTGKPAGVDNNAHRDRKSYTIQLLRVELLNQQSQNQSLGRKFDDTMKRLNESELARKNLEEEILKLVKHQRTLQNNTTKLILNDPPNRVGGGYDPKASARKSELSMMNSNQMVFNEHTDINEYLKTIETRKKEEEKKTKEELEIQNEIRRASLIAANEKKDAAEEEEKHGLEELNDMLNKREATFSNIKDSGATKELKQFLRKMANRKADMKKLTEEVAAEFDEISDTDSPTKKNGGSAVESKKVLVKKLIKDSKEKDGNKRNSIIVSNDLNIGKRNKVDKATGPDPAIFDIQIVEAMKFTIEKLKGQMSRIEEDSTFYQKENRRLNEDLSKLSRGQPLTNTPRTANTDDQLKMRIGDESTIMKSEMNELKKKTLEQETKIKSKKAKIKFLKNELTKQSSNNKLQDSNIDLMKMGQNELKGDVEKLKGENKALKAQVELLKLEIERLKKELGILNEDYLNLKDDFERMEGNCKKTKEGYISASAQIVLLQQKVKILENVVNSNEESMKKLTEVQNSEEFKKNYDEMKKNQEGLDNTSKNIEEMKMVTPRKKQMKVVEIEEFDGSFNKEKEKKTAKNGRDLMKGSSKSVISNSEKNKEKIEERGNSVKSGGKMENGKIIKNSGSKTTVLKSVTEEKKEDRFLEKEEVLTNFEKNPRAAGDQNKMIKTLQNRLQNEITQKEVILMEKRELEDTVVSLKREIYERDNSQEKFIKGKSSFPPILDDKFDKISKSINLTDFANMEKKNKPKSLEKPMAVPQNINNSAQSQNFKVMSKVPTKENSNSSIAYQMTNQKTEDSFIDASNINPNVSLHREKSNFGIINQKPPKIDNKFVNLDSKKYHIDKQNYSVNYPNPNQTEISSQKSLNKIEKGQSASEYAFNSFASVENLPNTIPNANSIFAKPKTEANGVINKREEERKKEEQKINVMFENMRDMVTLEGEKLLKSENPELAKVFQKIIAKANEKKTEENENVELGMEDFKEAINEIKNEHRRCGPNCIHLKRFYEKLGFSEKKMGKKLYYLHKRVINRLPQLS